MVDLVDDILDNGEPGTGAPRGVGVFEDQPRRERLSGIVSGAGFFHMSAGQGIRGPIPKAAALTIAAVAPHAAGAAEGLVFNERRMGDGAG